LFSGFTAAAGVCMLALPAYRGQDAPAPTAESSALVVAVEPVESN
jgi:hypothetical protein